MKMYSDRAGSLYHVQSDYDCYIPNSLSKIKINYDDELIKLLADANRLISKLDIVSKSLPNKDLFLSKYVEKEAVVSSQIEGTQASLSDVLQMNKIGSAKRKETEEIVNYVHALNFGIELLNELPLSTRYFKEIHKVLLKDVRGETKDPGELRRTQNWIGPNGCLLSNAVFVPPSVEKMPELLSDLEKYINSDSGINPLIDIALIHYQFETIHPFLDGNGRLGRLLIPLWLKNKGCLEYPVLYISLFFKQNRSEYYSLLMDVRFKGKYEEWIKFFLRGVIETANSSIQAIERINNLVIDINNRIDNIKSKNKRTLFKAMEYIYRHPYFNSTEIREFLNVSKPTALGVIRTLEDLNIISPIENKQRYITYNCDRYVTILEEGTEL